VAEVGNWWMDEISDRTNGQIQWDRYWGGALIGHREALDALRDGVIDATSLVVIMFPSELPLAGFDYWFPFSAPDISLVVRVKSDLYKNVPALDEELSAHNIQRIAWLPLASYNLESRVPISNLRDFQGVKIGHTPVQFSKIFSSVGAVSVISPGKEFYERLSRGVIDACVFSLDLAYSYSLQDVIDYYITVNLANPCPYLLCVNSDVYQRLKPEVQELFIEVGQEAQVRYCELLSQKLAKAKAAFEQAGVTFSTLPKDEISEWAHRVPDIAAEWVEKMVAEGLPGQQIATAYIELMEKAGYQWPRRWTME